MIIKIKIIIILILIIIIIIIIIVTIIIIIIIIIIIYLDVNFCKDHRDKIEVPDPLSVVDLISSKLNNKRKLARLITQYRDIFFSNISEGTAFLLQGVTENVTP